VKTFTDTAAERALIASVFLAGDADPARIVALTAVAYTRLAARVRAEDFADGRHARIWTAMAAVVDAGGGVEAVTVAAALRRAKGDAVTQEFLAGLTAEAVSPDNADAFAAIVSDLSARRRAIAAADAHRARLLDGEAVEGSLAALETATREGVIGSGGVSPRDQYSSRSGRFSACVILADFYSFGFTVGQKTNR
jgi:replicative DNA helicase